MKLSRENILSYFSQVDADRPRQRLLKVMEGNRDKGLHCQKCIGYCCTMQANSMKISPAEAIDLLRFFIEKFNGEDYQDSFDKLKKKLISNIEEFRLDKDYSFGKRFQIRRYYTCPFFKSKELGCAVDFNYKPYGCLAFEPTINDESWEKRGCKSDQNLLEKTINLEEAVLNEKLRELLDIHWDKLPIPVALLDIIEKVHK